MRPASILGYFAHLPLAAAPCHHLRTSVANHRDRRRTVRPASDVGQQTGQRPAQRHQPMDFGFGQCGLSHFTGAVNVPGTAQRRCQHDGALDPVPLGRRLHPGSELHRPAGMADRRRAVAGSHRQLGVHPGQSHRLPIRDPVTGELLGAGEQRRRGRQPSHPQRIGGKPRQCVDAGLRIAATRGPGSAVKIVRTPMPAELTDEGCLRAERQRAPPAGVFGTHQLRQIGPRHRVSALSTGANGTQPQFLAGVCDGKRPTARVGAEGDVGQHAGPDVWRREGHRREATNSSG